MDIVCFCVFFVCVFFLICWRKGFLLASSLSLSVAVVIFLNFLEKMFVLVWAFELFEVVGCFLGVFAKNIKGYLEGFSSVAMGVVFLEVCFFACFHDVKWLRHHVDWLNDGILRFVLE